MAATLVVDRTNTILYCRAWRATVHFYRTLLALPVSFENEWFIEFQLTAYSFLSIADASRATIRAVEGQGITLSWQVPDLNLMREHLLHEGVTVTPIQHKWAATLFYCHDPEGHRIEFWAREAAA